MIQKLVAVKIVQYTAYFDKKKYIYRNRCLKIQLIINGHKTETQLYKIVQYCAEEINDMDMFNTDGKIDPF